MYKNYCCWQLHQGKGKLQGILLDLLDTGILEALSYLCSKQQSTRLLFSSYLIANQKKARA